jgi:hypothetical protein
MMLTFLIPIVICVLTLLMLRLAYDRACRDYIKQRQPDAEIVVPTGTRTFSTSMPAASPKSPRNPPRVETAPGSTWQFALYDSQNRLQATVGAGQDINKCISLIRRTYAGWLNVEDFEIGQFSTA